MHLALPSLSFPLPSLHASPEIDTKLAYRHHSLTKHAARLPIHSVCLCTRRAKHIKAILIVCANLKIRPLWKRTQNAAGNAQQQQRHHPLGRCHVRIHFEGQQKHTGDDYDYDSSSLAAIRTHFTQFLLVGWYSDWALLSQIYLVSVYFVSIRTHSHTLFHSLKRARQSIARCMFLCVCNLWSCVLVTITHAPAHNTRVCGVGGPGRSS